MAQKSRELSQFSSFLEVDNSNKNISITTDTIPSIGIGTTNPTSKVYIVGDVNIEGNSNVTGIISASSYYLNGNPLVNAEVSSWVTSGFDVYRQSGNVGIGSTIPQSRLDVSGTTNTTTLRVLGVTTASRFISTVTTGTAPFTVSSQTLVTNLNADFIRGKIPPSGDIVGNNDTQTLTNKTINFADNTISGTLAQFNSALSDADFATISGSETLTNKTLTNPTISSISNLGTQNIPTGNGTLVSTNSVGVVTSGMILDGTITNLDIATGAGISISKLSASTISGVSLGSNLNNLTAGSFINYSSGTTYNGSSAVTISVAATNTNNANTVVSRDASGDFTAGAITGSLFNATTSDAFRVSGTTVINSSRNLVNLVNGSFTGIITAANLNATSSIQISGTTIINSSGISSGLQSLYNRVFTVGVNTTLVNRDFCEVTAAGVTITLPASPSIGNEVSVGVGTFINTVVARNGSNIMSLAEDITINSQYVNVGFLFVGGTVGWRIF